MFRSVSFTFAFFFSLTSLAADDLLPHVQSELQKHEAVLEGLEIDKSPEGVNHFLASLLDEKTRPSEEVVDALISQLGGSSFVEREKATKKLAALDNLPIEKIQAAAKHKDLEIAVRARRVLKMISNRPDPRVSVLRVVEIRKFPIDLKLLLDVVDKTDSSPFFEQALDAFHAVVEADDDKLVRTAGEHKNARIRAMAVRSWAKVETDNKKLIAKLQGSLEDEPVVRMAAVRALIEAGENLDTEKFAKLLDSKTFALVLRAEESRLREKHKDQRNDKAVMAKYRTFLDRYAQTLVKAQVVTRSKNQAANTQHWMDQGLNTSKHPELVMYRIRWFNGNWSPWFMPGFNDKEIGKGRNIRYWACFNDHEHEVVVATRKEFYRPINDLP